MPPGPTESRGIIGVRPHRSRRIRCATTTRVCTFLCILLYLEATLYIMNTTHIRTCIRVVRSVEQKLEVHLHAQILYELHDAMRTAPRYRTSVETRQVRRDDTRRTSTFTSRHISLWCNTIRTVLYMWSQVYCVRADRSFPAADGSVRRGVPERQAAGDRAPRAIRQVRTVLL